MCDESQNVSLKKRKEKKGWGHFGVCGWAAKEKEFMGGGAESYVKNTRLEIKICDISQIDRVLIGKRLANEKKKPIKNNENLMANYTMILFNRRLA